MGKNGSESRQERAFRKRRKKSFRLEMGGDRYPLWCNPLLAAVIGVLGICGYSSTPFTRRSGIEYIPDVVIGIALLMFIAHLVFRWRRG